MYGRYIKQAKLMTLLVLAALLFMLFVARCWRGTRARHALRGLKYRQSSEGVVN